MLAMALEFRRTRQEQLLQKKRMMVRLTATLILMTMTMMTTAVSSVV